LSIGEWIQAMVVVAIIYAVAMIIIIAIWRLAKRDEENRRLREEGPNHSQPVKPSKFSGTAH
jgi:hypothetical protein